jgi:hypothetical protein
MKPSTDRDELLRDVLADTASETFRDASLNECLAAARRTRAQRHFVRGVAFLIVPLLICASIFFVRHRRTAPEIFIAQPGAPQAVQKQTIPGTPIQIINDDQLLDLFKGRPVALVGPPGSQRLVLLDEAAN